MVEHPQFVNDTVLLRVATALLFLVLVVAGISETQLKKEEAASSSLTTKRSLFPKLNEKSIGLSTEIKALLEKLRQLDQQDSDQKIVKYARKSLPAAALKNLKPAGDTYYTRWPNRFPLYSKDIQSLFQAAAIARSRKIKLPILRKLATHPHPAVRHRAMIEIGTVNLVHSPSTVTINEGISAVTKALAIDLSHFDKGAAQTDAYFLKGRYQLQNNNYKGATNSFEMAVTLDPANFNAQKHLMYRLFANFQQLPRYQHDPQLCLKHLSQLMETLLRVPGLIENFNQFLDIAETLQFKFGSLNSAGAYVVGYAYLRGGDTETANKFFQKALDSKSNLPKRCQEAVRYEANKEISSLIEIKRPAE